MAWGKLPESWRIFMERGLLIAGWAVAVSILATIALSACTVVSRIHFGTAEFDWGGLTGAVIGLIGLGVITYIQLRAQRKQVRAQLTQDKEHFLAELNAAQNRWNEERKIAAWTPAIECVTSLQAPIGLCYESISEAIGEFAEAKAEWERRRDDPNLVESSVRKFAAAWSKFEIAYWNLPLKVDQIVAIAKFDADAGDKFRKLLYTLRDFKGTNLPLYVRAKSLNERPRQWPRTAEDLDKTENFTLIETVKAYLGHVPALTDNLKNIQQQMQDIAREFAQIAAVNVETLFNGRIPTD